MRTEKERLHFLRVSNVKKQNKCKLCGRFFKLHSKIGHPLLVCDECKDVRKSVIPYSFSERSYGNLY